ncbi:MAG: hypothetical protein RSD37_10670 [Clostridium sp.]
MFNEMSRIMRTEEEIKNDIMSDFANDFIEEVDNLFNQYGKDNFKGMISSCLSNIIT